MKSFESLILSALLTSLLFCNANATIRQVPAQFATVQAAHDAATAGDTILIAPGGPYGSLYIDRQLTFIGPGIDNLTATIDSTILALGSGGSVFEGLHVYSSSVGSTIQIDNQVGIVSFDRCKIETEVQATNAIRIMLKSLGQNKIVAQNCWFLFASMPQTGSLIAFNGSPNGFDTLVVRNSVISFPQDLTDVENRAISSSALVPSYVEIVNSVVINARTIVFDPVGDAAIDIVCLNNISWTNGPDIGFSWGNVDAQDLFSNNASNNVTPPGAESVLLTTSPFVSVPNDLHLHPTNGLPCIDTGLELITDILDGSRSDMGIYGGQTPFIDSGAPSYPYVSSFTVPAAVPAGDLLPIQATGRIGRQ